MSASLGDVLVTKGVVGADDLARAVERSQSEGEPLSKSLVTLGLASDHEIVAAVADQLDLAFADTRPGAVDPTAAALVPQDVASGLTALPVAFDGPTTLVVAMADPHNAAALERIAQLTGLRCVPALAVRADLQLAIEHLADVPATAGALLAAPAPPAAHGQAGANGNGAAAATATVVAEQAGLAYEEDSELDLNAVLIELVRRGGSDVHLTAGVPPMIRVHGELEPLEGQPVLTPKELQKTIYSILTQKERQTFENELELDVSYTVPDMARFRVNVFLQRDSVGAVMRVIPFEIQPIENLGIPTQVTNWAYAPRGFVLVTGPTGSGKSTTLASLIDVVNRERPCHVMTVEDPIEFLHSHKRSVVNQRELGTDTHSFASALKHVLRQDPDVILVGEMRDLETIQVALTAAETGHLVFGTLHTQDAPQTIDRVIDVFPPHQQEQIRVQLAGALQGVLCQQLLKTPDGQGRVVACEVMMATPAIKNLIREGKTHQMYSSIQAGRNQGMVTMDQSLADLVKHRKITYEQALERCNNVADFNRLSGRG